MRILNTYTEYVPPENRLTPEEIVDLCCSNVPVDECSEVGKVTPYDGAEQDQWDFGPDQALEQARADNPSKRIVSVQTEGIGPRPGEPCGKKYETWRGKNNCCDFVEPMDWDWENSAEVVAPGSRAIVGIIGGAPPFYVSVRGEGFTLDGWRIRDGWVDTRMFWVYASWISCGWGPIEVSDGCSIARGGIRSTVGKWSNNQYFYDVAGCVLSGTADESGNTWGVRIFSKTSGKWKQTITAENHWFAGGNPCLPDIYGIPLCYSISTYIPGSLASFCSGQVPANKQVWCWDNMYGGARASDPNGCCNPTSPQRPADVWCDKTIDAWTNEWMC